MIYNEYRTIIMEKKMKKFYYYINTMYPPAFYTLVAALTVFSITLGIIAVSLHQNILACDLATIYTYPKILEELYVRILPLLLCVVIADLNERKKKKG